MSYGKRRGPRGYEVRDRVSVLINAVDDMHNRGSVVPPIWLRRLRHNGEKRSQPRMIAAFILADICSWYRPIHDFDEKTGKPLKPRQRFAGDMLQQGSATYARLYGINEKTVRMEMAYLEEMGLIRREVRNGVYAGPGKRPLNNIQYVEPVPWKIADLSDPYSENWGDSPEDHFAPDPEDDELE